MRISADIETDGLDPTVIWCISAVDLYSDKTWHWGPEDIEEGISFLHGCELVAGHNFIAYDNKAFGNLHNRALPVDNIDDTMVMSMIYNPAIPKPKGLGNKGGTHSLAAWGLRLLSLKPEHEDWSQYSPEMKRRCDGDALLTKKLWWHLKKLLANWSHKSIRLEHDVTEILAEMSETGFYIDPNLTQKLYMEICTEHENIAKKLENIPPFAKHTSDYEYRVTKSGEVSSVGLRGWDKNVVGGDFSKIEWEPFNYNSTPQKVKLLEGWWEPTEPTKSGKSFKINETNLATLSPDAPTYLHDLARFAMLKSRKDLIDGWYNALGNDGRVHGSVFSCGAVTHRCAHFNPNMANIPGSESPYGHECREVFTTKDPANYRIVGIDADGVQLRVLAHYMKDPAYMELIDQGDIHSHHVEILGNMGFNKGELLDNGKWSNRPKAKNFIYAFLLGGGGPKLASLLDMPAKRGHGLKSNFLKRVPALKKLIDLATRLSKSGFIEGMDGRYVVVKDPYYVLSALLQSGEAILMKTAMRLLDRKMKQEKWDARFVAFVHDEWCIECHKDIADEVGEYGSWCIEEAGRQLGFRLPMRSGGHEVGLNWCDVH